MARIVIALGGNALSGGKFNMKASILGAYVIQFLTTTLYKMNVQGERQENVKDIGKKQNNTEITTESDDLYIVFYTI